MTTEMSADICNYRQSVEIAGVIFSWRH